MIPAAVGKYLATQLAALTYDAVGVTGNVFVEHMPSTPDLCIAVMGSGGNTVLGQASLPYDEPVVQVLIRGVKNDSRGAYDLARSVYSELQGLTATTFDSGGVDEHRIIRILASQSAPIPMGPDSTGRQRYSTNFAIHTTAITANRV